MKSLLLFVLTTLLLISCKPKQVDGKYFLIKSNGRESQAGGDINNITFTEDHCSFEFVGFEMSGPVLRENNFLYIEMGGELGTLTMEITDWQTLEGEGFIGGTFKHSNYFKARNVSNLGYYNTTRSIYLRAGAGNKYAILLTINKGEKISNIMNFENGWSQIEYGGMRGFVQSKYLIKE